MRAFCAASMLVALGCGEATDGSAYVLVDEEARQAQVVLEVRGQPAPAVLPVEVTDAHDRLELVTPSGRQRLELAPGELVWVRGGGASVERLRMGAEARADALFVRGDQATARRLASALGVGPPQGASGGAWLLEGEQAFARSAWMNEVPGVVEAEPVRAGAGPAPPIAELAAREPPPAPPNLGADGVLAAIGFYTAGDRGQELLLDAEGGYRFWDGCANAAAQVGRYRIDDGRLWLEGLDRRLAVGADGRLEADGMTFSRGGEP